MINRIVAIQGNHPSKLNPQSDTSIFLANEIQKKNYRIFYYEPKNLSIIRSQVIADGFFIKFSYKKKNFFKILRRQKLNLNKCKFILIRQDPPFNLGYISTTYILDAIKKKVKIINNPSSIRNVSEKLYSSKYLKYMPPTIFTLPTSSGLAFSFFNGSSLLTISSSTCWIVLVVWPLIGDWPASGLAPTFGLEGVDFDNFTTADAYLNFQNSGVGDGFVKEGYGTLLAHYRKNLPVRLNTIVSEIDENDIFTVETKASEGVLFHPLTIHRSVPATKINFKPRYTIDIRYYDENFEKKFKVDWKFSVKKILKKIF